MSTAKYLYQTVFWRGLVYLASFILNICIARIYGAEISGVFFYNISIYSLVVLVFSLSLESGFGFYASNNKIPVNQLFSLSLLWVCFASLVSALLYYLIFFPDAANRKWLFAALPFISGNILLSYLSTIFYAKKNFLIPNIIMFLVYLILILILPGLIFIPTLSVDYLQLYQWSFLVMAVILASAFYFTQLARYKWQWPSMVFIKLIARYSFWAWLGNIIFFFLFRVDYWFVQQYCSSSDLGNYIQVSRLAQVFFLIPSIIASVIFPLTASGQKKELLQVISLISRLFLWIYIIICLLLAISGKVLFHYLFGATYDNMYMPFIFIIPGILSLSMLYPLTAYNAGMNRLKLNLKACLIALVCMIAGDYIFIPRYGINAAALISSCSYMILHFILFYNLQKNEKTILKDFFMLQKNDFYLIKSYFTGST